ncbi:MAG TPA: ABC transporter permease [Terriglobales bacterium]|nr:ABC transporter permease [Terriglobales bacterium]
MFDNPPDRSAYNRRIMEALLRDVRFAFRMFAKNPGLIFAAIFTLALAIGANTAMFTVTSALLLRPFPYSDPQQLVTIQVKDRDEDRPGTLLRYELLRNQAKSFQIAAWANDNFNLTGRGEPIQVPVARVSSNFFSLLGVKPDLGRTFTQDEGHPESKPVVMLSNAIWHSRFGGDPNILGQTVTLDTTPHTIVGVLPANVEFPFVGQAEIWTPRYFELTLMSNQRLRMGVGYLGYVARLRDQVPVSRAQAELAILNQQYRDQNPSAPDADPSTLMLAAPLRDLVVGDVRGKLLLLSGAVVVVLLIACANVASLLLSRALARKREIAVRTALGATRGALVRQLLTESMLLAITAGILGVALSWAATRALLAWGASQLPAEMPIGVDFRVLLFALVVSLLTGVIFGAMPALQFSKVDVESALRAEGRAASAGHRRTRMKGLLVIGQVALSLLLLIAAGLLLRSFGRLVRTDPGFEPHNALTLNVSLPTVKYAKAEQQIAFFDEVLRRVSSLPGVRNAATSAALPLSWVRYTPVLADGQPDVPLAQRPFIDIEAISPQWFQTLRVPIRAGRSFTDADNAQAPKVIVVNESFAHRFWPNQNPIGKHVVVGRWPDPAAVVGVAADIKNRGLAQETQAQIYLPFPQLPWGRMNLLVRTAVPPLSLTSAIRGQIAAVDPDQPVTSIETVDNLVDASRAQARFITFLLGAFSVTALILAVIGIYGVLSYSVTQRQHELGIRLALGAQRSDVLLLVLKQGLRLAVVGIAIGLVAALLLTNLMSSMLYHVGARDLATFALTPLIFLAIALLASYLPARRTAKLDPMDTLRVS